MTPHNEAAVRECWAANADAIRSFVSERPHIYHTVWLTARELTEEQKAERYSAPMEMYQLTFTAEWDDARKLPVVCADVVLE